MHKAHATIRRSGTMRQTRRTRQRARGRLQGWARPHVFAVENFLEHLVDGDRRVPKRGNKRESKMSEQSRTQKQVVEQLKRRTLAPVAGAWPAGSKKTNKTTHVRAPTLTRASPRVRTRKQQQQRTSSKPHLSSCSMASSSAISTSTPARARERKEGRVRGCA